jgi:Holliday junction resolvasome RuvABC endonuclease subunit
MIESHDNMVSENTIKNVKINKKMKTTKTLLTEKDDENLCRVNCEAYILKRRNIEFNPENLSLTVRENYWFKNEGTPLHAIGQLLVKHNLPITRKYNSTIDDIEKCLSLDNDIIVAVNTNKLYAEESTIDEGVNHAVVVNAIDTNNGTVNIYDPEHEKEEVIPIAYFQNAWKDSLNYMVRVLRSVTEYAPEPINVDDITINDDLNELWEAIAENLHDVWAKQRMKEGWTYGPERNDSLKQHPDILPYCLLKDSEKEYDRLMAQNTLKLVQKLGFVIKKR